MSAIRQLSSYATVFLLFFSFFFASKSLVAQAPEGVNYQAVARDNNGDPLANQIISVRFSIVATSTSGTVLYEEEHSTISTNDFGLFNLVIGQGTKTGGTAANFAAVDWGSGNRYLRVQVDAGNGFENLGTTQLLSVPYALYSKTSGNSSATTLKGGDGIILRNDSIINDGDLLDNNELITSFTIETGNILRITEASTNYDIDLTPYLNSSSDDQNLRFSQAGDSILIEDGDGIEIQFILDDIAANAADIATNTSAIIFNTDSITRTNDRLLIKITADSLLRYINDTTLNGQLRDTSAVMRSLIGGGNTDNQQLSFGVTNDTIVLQNGGNIVIKDIRDSIANYHLRMLDIVNDIGTNTTDISTNQADIGNLNTDVNTLQANFYTDSLQTLQNQDSIGILATLIGSDNDADSTNERISSAQLVGDSIIIVENNSTFYVDLTKYQVGINNDNDSTNEKISSIVLSNDSLIIYENGILSGAISMDSLFINERKAVQNKVLQNILDIDANTTAIYDSTLHVREDLSDTTQFLLSLINSDNDTDSTNEIQQLSLVADTLRISDPSGAAIPIDLSIYKSQEDSTRIANGTSRIYIPSSSDSLLFNVNGSQVFNIAPNGRSLFHNAVGINVSTPTVFLDIASNNEGLVQQITAVGGDGPGDGLRVDANNGLGDIARGIQSFANGDGNSYSIIANSSTSSATDSSVALFATASGNQNVYSGFFERGNVYVGDTLILPTNAGRGKVLTSDANGKAFWQPKSGIGSGNVGEITFFTADDSLRSSSKLFWDETNERLGIGMSTPAAKLCIWDTLFTSNTTVNVRTYADNTFGGGNIYSINSYVENEPFTFIDTAFGVKTRVTGDAEYKFGVHSYVYGGSTPQKYYALYGVSNGSEEAFGLYTKAINGVTENWSAYLDTGNVYIEDTLILNRTFKLPTGAVNGSVLTTDANGVASWSPAVTYGNVNTAGSNTAGRVAYWNNADSITFYDDLFIDETYNRVGIGTNTPSQKLEINGGIRVSGGYNANNGTSGLPSFRFSNDANTGMFSDAVNELAFTTGGSEAARFDANGNFGIGTPSPDSTLTINGGIKTTYFTMTDGAASGFVLNSDANGVASWVDVSTLISTPTLAEIIAAGNDANADSINNVNVITLNDKIEGAMSANNFLQFIGNNHIRLEADDFLDLSSSRRVTLNSGDSIVFRTGGTTRFNISQAGDVSISDTLLLDKTFRISNGAAVGSILVSDAYGNAAWTSMAAATTCPTGMSNIAGTNICIDTDERAASSNWFDAAAACVSAGYKLPNWAEWYGAAAALTLTNETDDWEWVSDGTSNTARKVGSGDIKATANDDPESGSASYRCIYYK